MKMYYKFLKKLKKVKHVDNTHVFIYEINFSTSEDMRSHVFDFAHDNQLKILQLNQKNASLESLFRELTGDYAVPDDACNTYRAMLDGLKQLETDMHQHVHKENSILFPRAIQLEESRGHG